MYSYITSGHVDLQRIHVLCIEYVYISVQYEGKGKMHPCTVTEALYMPYGP